MVQIEPIEISGNNGVLFKAYRSMYNDCKWHVEVLDDVDGILFTSWITAESIQDVAQKLSLKIQKQINYGTTNGNATND